MSLITPAGIDNDDIVVIKNHFVSKEVWLGKKTVQTGTNWAEEFSLTPFRVISGDNDFGSDLNDEAKIMGTDDTPIFEGQTAFKIFRLFVIETNEDKSYILKILWGLDTMQEAIEANQFTSLMLTYDNSPMGLFDLIMPRLDNGYKIWMQCKCSEDNAYLDFFIGVFGFE